VGRCLGVERDLGVGVTLGVLLDVAVGVGVAVGVPLGVAVAITVDVGVGVEVGVLVEVGVAVGLDVAVGVGVGVGPDCAQYLPPVTKSLPLKPPQTIISFPLHTAVCEPLACGALLVLVAAQLSELGSYLPPVFKY